MVYPQPLQRVTDGIRTEYRRRGPPWHTVCSCDSHHAGYPCFSLLQLWPSGSDGAQRVCRAGGRRCRTTSGQERSCFPFCGELAATQSGRGKIRGCNRAAGSTLQSRHPCASEKKASSFGWKSLPSLPASQSRTCTRSATKTGCLSIFEKEHLPTPTVGQADLCCCAILPFPAMGWDLPSRTLFEVDFPVICG